MSDTPPVPGGKCPQCRAKLDDVTSVREAEALPKAGNLCVCGYCGACLRFVEVNGALQLAFLSAEEFRKLSAPLRADLERARTAAARFRQTQGVCQIDGVTIIGKPGGRPEWN